MVFIPGLMNYVFHLREKTDMKKHGEATVVLKLIPTEGEAMFPDRNVSSY
jgi:hypothetical protein